MNTQSVEIICVGTELLIGWTTNTNAQWLTRQVTSLGLGTRRITNVGDDIDEIFRAVRGVIQRHPRFLIITGGLGPTFDDKTLEGLAKALGRDLEINNDALKIVEERYRKYVQEGKMEKFDLTPPRIKMAKLPKGAKPLFNPVGTAPGVVIECEHITIVALPGVPSEMKAIFEESVASLLKQVAGDLTFFETNMEVTKVMESKVSSLIDRVMIDNPYVYIKSHPKGTETVPRIEFHFSTTAKSSSLARKRVGKALIQLSELIRKNGGKVKPIKAEN